MRADSAVVASAPGVVAHALAWPGEAYAVYFDGRGPVQVELALPAGTYTATWIAVESGATVGTGSWR